MDFKTALEHIAGDTYYLDSYLNDLLAEMCGDNDDWESICDATGELVMAIDKFYEHLQSLPESERDTEWHKQVWDANWNCAYREFDRIIDEHRDAALDDAGDDEIADELRTAYAQTSYSKTTNETTYPASWAGYETGPGTGLQSDCTTSDYYNQRIKLAAQHVAAQYDVEIDDDDCDSMESAADAIRAAISELETA